MNLKGAFYVLSFSKNLVSVARLISNSYGVSFENGTFSVFNNKGFASSSVLINGLYKIDLYPTFEYNYLALDGDCGKKKNIINENSSLLWHKRLRHIFIDRTKRSVSDGILKTLDFIDFETCVYYINGKQNNNNSKGAKMSYEIFEIIHTNVADHFPLLVKMVRDILFYLLMIIQD